MGWLSTDSIETILFIATISITIPHTINKRLTAGSGWSVLHHLLDVNNMVGGEGYPSYYSNLVNQE